VVFGDQPPTYPELNTRVDDLARHSPAQLSAEPGTLAGPTANSGVQVSGVDLPVRGTGANYVKEQQSRAD
jgi:hypothetical protein